MKKQILTVALGFITIVSFGQKNELKAAEKAIKKQDYTAAVSSINTAEALIANADDKLKSKFYFLKGQAFGGKKDYEVAAKAYNDLFDFEKQVGKKRYTDKAAPLLNTLKEEVNKRAFSLHEAKNFKESSKAFYLRYTLDKKDTLFLSNAAQLALQAEDYDNSFKLYSELKDLGYTGIVDIFEATDKATGKKVTFNSKDEMNFMSKSGKYNNPQVLKSKSKKGEVLKNLLNVLSKQKKYDEAVALIKKIRKSEPDNLELLLAEAFLYNDLKQPKKFEALMKEATEKDPTNPDLFFNIGIVNYNEKNVDPAVKYFSKAVALKADYPKGNWMLANAMLLKDEAIVVKMNALPPSDMTNYDKYEKERKDLFTSILPVLMAADKADRTAGTVRMLMGVCEQLEMSDKADEFRKILKTLE
jgi:tetratricopeptide (TPR) repeat protein